MVVLVIEILIFLVLALLLGTLLGFLLSRSMVSDVRTSVEQLKLDVAANRKRVGAAETDLQLHKGSLNELRAAYDGLQERLSVHSDRQADLSGQMEGLVAARSALSERTAALASQLTEAQAGLGRQLEASQQSLGGRIDDLSADRDNLVQRVSALEYVSERLSSPRGAPGAEPARAARAVPANDVEARIRAVEERVSSLVAQDSTTASADLSHLLGRQRSAEERLVGLQDRLDVLAEADNVLSSRLESMSGLPLRLTSLDENQQDLESRVRALETLPEQVESTRGQVEWIQSTTTALNSRLEHQDRWGQEAEDRIGALESRLSGIPGGQQASGPASGPASAPAAPPAAANEPVPAAPKPAAAAATAEPAVPAVALDDLPNDNLKRIRGVGVALEKTLNRAGVRRFEQIAAWTKEDIEAFSGPLEKYQGRILRDDWIAQAQALLAERDEQASPSKAKTKQPQPTI